MKSIDNNLKENVKNRTIVMNIPNLNKNDKSFDSGDSIPSFVSLEALNDDDYEK